MKEQLMNTAIALWKEYGYDAVSIPMICKQCGVTKGSFYHHYKSKDDVLLSYFQIKEKPKLPDILSQIILEPLYIEKIWILMKYYTIVAMELGPDLFKYLIHTDMKQGSQLFPSTEDQTKKTSDTSYELLLSIAKEGQKKGEVRIDETAEKLIELVEASFTGLLLYWSVVESKFDVLERQYDLLHLLLENKNR